MGEVQRHVLAQRPPSQKSSLHRMALGTQNVSFRTLEQICQRLKIDITDLFSSE